MPEIQNVEIFNYNNNAVIFLLLTLIFTLTNFILQLINNQSYFTSNSTNSPYYSVSSISSLQLSFIFGIFFWINKLYTTPDDTNNPDTISSSTYALILSLTFIFLCCGLLIFNIYKNYS